MNSYTEKLESGASNLYEYEAAEELPRIIASFRGHGAALSRFLDEHGFSSDHEDTPEAKAAFFEAEIQRRGNWHTKGPQCSQMAHGTKCLRAGNRVPYRFCAGVKHRRDG